MTDNTSFVALVRWMRLAQKTYYLSNQANMGVVNPAEKAVDAALKGLPDNRPGIHVGCWYGDEDDQAAHPAAYIGLPPTEDGEVVEAVLDVFQDTLDVIAPGDDALHEFILKWERYALNYYLPFDVSEDFECVDNRWQLVEDA
ncbi:MAG: hypothetical protein QMD04_14675 [Anaerolineales bacterium]|nr:hypothetical protein [Anaerolineales bacterium]